MDKLRLVGISDDAFQSLKDKGALSPSLIYAVRDIWGTQWAYSPDGYGAYFYDSLQEARHEHS